MWIRSQNKAYLYNAKEIFIYNDSIKVNGVYFGNYKTEKRCMEIIDDIQEKMFNCDRNYAYEMPKE